jgi:hypothetical protein
MVTEAGRETDGLLKVLLLVEARWRNVSAVGADISE